MLVKLANKEQQIVQLKVTFVTYFCMPWWDMYAQKEAEIILWIL
jgi:hypothetical protein